MGSVTKRYATDETFREVANLLFGGGADELVAKMSPTQSDVHANGAAKKDHRQRAVTAGLSAVGAGAGAYGLGVGANEVRRNAKKLGSFKRGLKATPKSVKALVPLEMAGLGGEIMATKILHGDVKKPKQTMKKSAKDIVEQASTNPKGKLTRAAVGRAADSKFITTQKGKLKQLPEKVIGRQKMSKSHEDFSVTWRGEISKVDEDKRQVFGWASIVEMNGEPVVDLQGDYISVDEIEKSAYDYVHKSRKGGDMHRRNGADPHHVSDMIESFVVTPEKKEKLGLPDDFPTGWWVGYQVHDDDTWNLVKSGSRTGFSIHGSGTRKAIDG